MTDKELLDAIRAITREEVERAVLPIQATLDHEIKPAIKLLAEGHESILEHIDEKIADRTDKLEWRLEALESVVRQHLREAKQA